MKTSYLLSLLFLFVSIVSFSQSPKTISYQGVLTDNDGESISDGSYTLNFTLYDDVTGGTLMWEEDITTELSGGIFSVILGQTEELDLYFDQPYWLGISIDGGDELAPRTALTAAPYSLGGKATELDLREAPNFNKGLIVEGQDTSIYIIPLEGSIYFGPDSMASGLRGKNSTRQGTVKDIRAFNANLSVNMLRASNSNGTAVDAQGDIGIFAVGNKSYGIRAISFDNHGILGESLASNKAGVYGANNSFGGVLGKSDNGRGVIGTSKNSIGVKGEGPIYGVEAIGTGAAGVGLRAEGASFGITSSGSTAAARFDGDVRIEESGQLKIDQVQSDQSDNILVWADNKFVKTRSLNDAVQDLLPDDADMDPSNEIQKLTKDGPVITLDKNGQSVTLLDDNPTNELFNGVLNDQQFLVNIGGASTFQVNNDRCTFVDGALGVNGILDKPTITSAAENNVAVFGFNNSTTLPTISLANTTPGGPVFSAQGNSFFGNGTNTFVIITPGETQVAELFGDVRVHGNFIAISKSFLIDHPLEPEIKQLRHFSIESDQLTNIYNGNVVMDEKGEAWVELPEWFEALNKEFTYQMTCIGGFANVYIAEEINDNQFKIAGGKSGLKVSWQVSGIRHDKQAQEIDQSIEVLKQ